MNANVPVEPWELSGLLDGELSPERAAQVRAAIESDPALRQQWETLARLDHQWSDRAAGADFAVRVSLPIVRWPLAASVLVGVLLLVVRFVPKFIAPTVGLLLQSAVLALLLTCAVVLVNKAEAGMGVRTASPRPSSRPA
jgi:anti-sigma factor RsiW